MDHYETLGVTRTASTQDIKKAYRKLASKHHPDKGGDANQFKKVSEAYEILSDPEKKQFFDQYGSDSPQGQGFDPFGGNSPFADIFGQHFREQPQRRNPDAMVDLTLDMETAYHGKDVVVDVGYAREVISIVPGTRSGAKVRIAGKGHSRFRDMPAGDLIVRMNVRPNPGTGIDGNDILQVVRINSIEAMTGTEVEIDHVSGKKLKIKIPESSQEGARLRLSNWGMPRPGGGSIYGNLYAIIEIYTPRITDSGHLDMLNKIKRELDR